MKWSYCLLANFCSRVFLTLPFQHAAGNDMDFSSLDFSVSSIIIRFKLELKHYKKTF